MKLKKFLYCFFIIVFCFNFLYIKNIHAVEDSPDIGSPSAILIDSNTGKVLFEKNSKERRYPASLTKVMTAIIVLENCKLTDTATVSYDSVTNLSYGYVTGNLQADEELSVKDLLYVMMVGSANDSAIVLAEHVSGSVDEFSKLMNEKAREIGCLDTNFVNPNGVHNENHYSTAYDLALIARYAMKNDIFREIVSTTHYTLPSTNKYEKNDRVFGTTNDLLVENNNNRADNYYYKYANGIKTGFTTPAGNCLIASASKDDLTLISVVLGSGLTKDGLSQRYIDTKTLLNYGYENYTLRKLHSKNDIVQTIKVKHASKSTKQLDVAIKNDLYILSEKKDSTLFNPEISINENLKAPVTQGEIIGKIHYSIDSVEYTENLIASKNVKSSKLWLKFLIFIIVVLILYIYLNKRKFKKRINKLVSLKSKKNNYKI